MSRGLVGGVLAILVVCLIVLGSWYNRRPGPSAACCCANGAVGRHRAARASVSRSP